MGKRPWGVSETDLNPKLAHLSLAQILRDAVAARKKLQAGPGSPVEPSPQLHPLHQVIQLKITAGPQAGSTWSIGYGPRYLGSNADELWTSGPEAEGCALELTRGPNGLPQIRAVGRQPVFLNQKRVQEASDLNHGDQLDFADTHIEIQFEN